MWGKSASPSFLQPSFPLPACGERAGRVKDGWARSSTFGVTSLRLTGVSRADTAGPRLSWCWAIWAGCRILVLGSIQVSHTQLGASQHPWKTHPTVQPPLPLGWQGPHSHGCVSPDIIHGQIPAPCYGSPACRRDTVRDVESQVPWPPLAAKGASPPVPGQCSCSAGTSQGPVFAPDGLVPKESSASLVLGLASAPRPSQRRFRKQVI